MIFVYLIASLVILSCIRSFCKISSQSLPVVTSSVPWIGTVIELFNDALGLLQRNRERYGSVYTMSIAGHQVIVVCHREGVVRIMRDAPKCLTNSFNTRMLEAVGGVKSNTITHVLFGKLSGLITRSFSTRAISKLAPAYTQRVVEELMSLVKGQTQQPIHLSQFVGECLYRAVSSMLFGPRFPLDTYADFMCVDSQIPRLLSPILFPPRQATRARKNLKKKLGAFIHDCWDDIHGLPDAALAGTAIIRTLREAALPPCDEQGVLLAFLLGLHANSLRVTTWFLAFLLSDQVALSRIREEIDHVIDTEFGSLDALFSSPVQSLGKENFPLLDSALKETMRLSVPPVFMRAVKVETNFPIDDATNITVKRGQYLVADGCSLNMGHDIFEDSNEFRYDRFVQFDSHEDAEKHTHLPVSPFGGGIHACKGQDFAVYEMKVFAIVCLRLLNVTAETSTGTSMHQVHPKANTSIPTPVMYLEDGIFVRVSKRD